MLKWSPQLLREQFASLADTTQIIFIHPQYYHQNRVVHYLTELDNITYIRFEGENLTTSDLHSQVSENLSQELSDAIEMIILDECDRATTKDFNAFLREFADSHNHRIAVISRTVAYNLIADDEFRKRCQFVPVNEDFMLFDYAQRDRSTILVEVRAFGSGRVHVNGRPIDHWDGILPRRLFFYLADRGMATRNDIFETFWPNLNKNEATNVFHVTKRKITDIIGESFTKFGGGFYRISPQIEFYYDVINFSTYIQKGLIAEGEEAIELLENALSFYHSPFLNSEEDQETSWIEKRREEINEMFAEALSMLANHKLKQGNEEDALGHYLKALKILNYREEIAEQVMRIYQKHGQYTDALALYEWIKTNLQENFEIEPGQELQELARSIQESQQTSS